MDSRIGERDYTIVVGVEASPGGLAALRWAVGEARAYNGRVRIIHAWTSAYDWQMEVVLPPNEARLRRDAQERLDEILSSVDTKGVRLKAEVVQGDPRRVLLEAAKDADLLVIGSHGRGAIREALLPSVSTYCARNASRPVVVVHSDRRPHATERPRSSTVSP